MAKSKGSSTHQYPSKPKTSLFLCCFGSSSSPTKGSLPISNMKKKRKKKTTTTTSWFSWLRIRFTKKSSHKTVPFEASINSHDSKPKSKSTLPHKPQPPATTVPPPAPVHPSTPYYTPTQVFILIIRFL